MKRTQVAGVAAVGWLGSLPMCLGTGGGLGKLASAKASFGSAASVAPSCNRNHPAAGRAQSSSLEVTYGTNTNDQLLEYGSRLGERY